MSYFPMCIDLAGRTVFLVGGGPQTADKAEKLRPFGPRLVRADTFTQADAEKRPALVVVGDRELREAERISALCAEHGIPVNVVDVPRLSTFFFPALIRSGELTVSVSTGGSCPAAAACLRERIQEQIPDRTGEILDWLASVRQRLKEDCTPGRYHAVLSRAAAAAFDKNSPLTDAELACILSETGD